MSHPANPTSNTTWFRRLAGAFLIAAVCSLAAISAQDQAPASSSLPTPVAESTPASESTPAVLANGAAAPPASKVGIPLTIHGRVLAENGKPLSGVSVVLRPRLPVYERDLLLWQGKRAPAAVRFENGTDGTFELTAPDVGFWQIELSKSGHESQVYDLVPLTEDTFLVDATLPAAKGIEVKILGSDGKPSLARLLARNEPRKGTRASLRRSMGFGGSAWRPSAWVGHTDDRGKVLLPIADPSAWKVEVVAADHVPLQSRLGKTTSTLRLQRGMSRQLVVTGESGKVAEGVIVQWADRLLPFAVTDAEGNASLPLSQEKQTIMLQGPLGGEASLQLPALDSKKQAEVEVPEDGAPQHKVPQHKVELDAADRVFGRVITSKDRLPVADGLVWTTNDRGLVMARSDASGNYALQSPQTPSWRLGLSAAAHGYSVAVVMGDPAREQSAEGPTLVLEPAVSFWGTVVDPDGEPLAGTEGRLELGSSKGGFDFKGMLRAHQSRALSDAQGRLIFNGLPADRGFTLHLEKPGFANTEHRIDALLPFEQRPPSNWQMVPGQRGFGYVIDAEDQPIVGAEVRLVPSEGSGRLRRFRLPSGQPPVYSTDAEGYFEAPDLAAGRYDLEASASGFSRGTARGIEVPEGAGEMDLGALILAPGIDLEGAVADSQGQPIEGVDIFSQAADDRRSPLSAFLRGGEGATTQSDAEGRFVIPDGAAGDRLTITATKEGYVSQSARSISLPSEQRLKIVLQTASKVTGRVVDAEGVPLEGVLVDASPEEKSAAGRFRSFDRQQQPTGVDGYFEVPGVQPGPTMLRAQKSGFKSLQLGGFEVPADRPLQDVELRMVAGADLEGTLTDADGEPVGGVMIMVLASGTNMVDGGFGQTDGDGKFLLSGLPLGSFTATARGEGLNRASKNVTIEAGRNKVDLQFARSASVSGTVYDDGGRPLQGARINLAPQERRNYLGGQSAVDSREDGTFTIDSVPAGRYRMSASKKGYGSRQLDEPVEVTEAPVVGLQIRLGGGASITGRILGLAYEEMNRVEVTAFSAGGEVTQPDFEGKYRVDHLPPGPMSVEARLEGSSRSVRQAATLEEGQQEVVIDLEFVDGFELKGTVYRTGEPEANAPVSLSSTRGSHGARVTTTADGTFRFEGLSEGGYYLQVGNWSTSYRLTRELELDRDKDVRIDLELAHLAGRVLDTDGNPVSGAKIILSRDGAQSQNASSDSLGRFTFGEITVGHWKLSVRRSGYGNQTETVELETGQVVDDLEIRLEAVAGLVLEVKLEDGRSAALINAVFINGVGGHTGGRFHGDDQGQFVVDVVPEGSWQMIVSTSGYAATERAITVPSQEPLAIQLQREGRLQVIVPALEDEAAASTVQIFNAQGQLFRSASTQSEVGGSTLRMRGGNRHVRELSAGPYTVVVTAADGQIWRGQITVIAGETQLLRLE